MISPSHGLELVREFPDDLDGEAVLFGRCFLQREGERGRERKRKRERERK